MAEGRKFKLPLVRKEEKKRTLKKGTVTNPKVNSLIEDIVVQASLGRLLVDPCADDVSDSVVSATVTRLDLIGPALSPAHRPNQHTYCTK